MKHLQQPPIWLLFLLVAFPQMSETIYSPALPNIAQALNTENQYVQWTLSIYFIGFAFGVFFWGRLSDHIGRRPSMLSGVVIYCISSFLCLMCNHVVWLLFTRLAQGFGASCGSVLTQAIARESLDEKSQHTFFSLTGFVLALAISVGPLFGGYLTEWLHWRANFALLVIIGVLLCITASYQLPETLCRNKAPKVTIRAVVRQFMTDKKILSSIWLVAAINGVLFSYYAEGPFIFIDMLHCTESQYGWLGLCLAFAAFMGSIVSKRLVHHLPRPVILNIGCALMLLSSGILTSLVLSGYLQTISDIASISMIMLSMMGLIFAGFGFIIPVVLSSALLNYQSTLGTAGALFGLSYYILISLLTAIMGAIHNGALLPMPLYFLISRTESMRMMLLIDFQRGWDSCSQDTSSDTQHVLVSMRPWPLS